MTFRTATSIELCYAQTTAQLHSSHTGGTEVKESACNVGVLGSIPGLGRSPGEGNGNLLQYSCLENPMDGGAWWAIVHRSQRVRHYGATSLSLSHASKVMLKILQARLQQYVNRELPDVQDGFRNGTRDQIANIHWIMEKAREFQKNIYFCFID